LRQTYLLKVKGNLSDSEIGKVAAVTRVRIERGQRGENPWYEVTMADASRDPLRQELLQMGHPVEKMKRIKIGPLEIGDLAPGRFRSLTLKEVTALESAVKKAAAQPQAAAGSSRPAGRPRRRILSRGRKPG
jgi:23S rRNA pseudouridine2605 synthase